MAQGRGSAMSPSLLLLLLLLSFHSCCWRCQLVSATTYTVGEAAGWNLGVDYTQWVAGKTFKVGDILFFPYVQSEHNVVVVDKSGYGSCTASASATTYAAGNTNITLSAAGDRYYLCSVEGHCSGGMKLAVTVAAGAGAPPPTSVSAPAPSVAEAPPKATPASAPKSAPPKATPASAPKSAAPKVTPASAPGPAVTAPTPAVTTPAPSSASAAAPGPSASSGAPLAGTPSSSVPAGSSNLSPPPLPSSASALYRGVAGLFGLVVLALSAM